MAAGGLGLLDAFQLQEDAYQVVRTLGKGSFGQARLFQRLGDHRLVVCKTVMLAQLNDEEIRDARNEVAMLSKLRHPNIVSYIASFEQQQVLYIVMEYANSGDLEGLVKEYKQRRVKAIAATPPARLPPVSAPRRPVTDGSAAAANNVRPASASTVGDSGLIPEPILGSLFVQMCHAVRYLHERRILHRDLKAQNVFLHRSRPDGPLIVKLGDFGISTVLRNTMALAKTVCGTPYYFSPELCMSKPYNNKSDVWSLGCILYELCTLTHAFDAANLKMLVQRILKGSYTPIPSVYSRDCAKLIEAMLELKVARRFNIQQVASSAFVQTHAAIMCNDAMQRTLARGLSLSDWVRSAKQGTKAVVSCRVPPTEPSAHLEKMADIKLKAELMSFEQQQKRVDEARGVVQRTLQGQDARQEAAQRHTEQLDELRKQMELIECKMQERKRQEAPLLQPSAGGCTPPAHLPVLSRGDAHHPFAGNGNLAAGDMAQLYRNRVSTDAPWNVDRDVPMGFTKETWEQHKIMQARAAIEAPLGGKPQRASGVAPAIGEAPKGPIRGGPDVDAVYGGVRPLAQFDVDAILNAQKAKRQQQQQHLAPQQGGAPGVDAARLWEDQKREIRAASQFNGPSMTHDAMLKQLAAGAPGLLARNAPGGPPGVAAAQPTSKTTATRITTAYSDGLSRRQQQWGRPLQLQAAVGPPVGVMVKGKTSRKRPCP
mgnify:CR=1 FL=1